MFGHSPLLRFRRLWFSLRLCTTTRVLPQDPSALLCWLRVGHKWYGGLGLGHWRYRTTWGSLGTRANICSNLGMSPLTRGQLDAAARALNRAAEHFDERANAMDERVAHWRKDHRPGQRTRRGVNSARRCSATPGLGGEVPIG
jgi:hypothetical protein